MNMLPPGRPGVSSSVIICRTRAKRAGLSARTKTLFERGSAMMDTRCRLSIGAAPPPAGSASNRFKRLAISIAEALLSGTRIGSPPWG